jgi:hypothetical protein
MSVATHDPVPAAQYVRMSDDGQQYSIDNQKAAIEEYAKRKGFVVGRTCADAGKSGLVLHRREALRKLLEDVDLGNADYKATLVLCFESYPSSISLLTLGVEMSSRFCGNGFKTVQAIADLQRFLSPA